MSNKPLKKTDKNKPWIEKRRNKIIKIQPEYHMIICEGTKTEPNYFIKMKEIINAKHEGKIEVDIKGKGRGTTELLKEAIKEVNNSKNYISHAWIVYDKDEFSEKSFNDVYNECNKINRDNDTIFHPIWSNECIEIWFLMHFDTIDTAINREECIKKLNDIFKDKNLGTYKKNDAKIYDKLEMYIETALNNARWLSKKYEDEILPSNRQPSTEIYKLIEMLKAYM